MESRQIIESCDVPEPFAGGVCVILLCFFHQTAQSGRHVFPDQTQDLVRRQIQVLGAESL